MVLDTQTVAADILAWSETFVEVPHPALGGWPPCPFARQARLNRTIQVLTGADPYFDLKNREDNQLNLFHQVTRMAMLRMLISIIYYW